MPAEHKKIGRPKMDYPTWSIDPFDRTNSTSCALISMCIKENIKQTMEELAVRLAKLKKRPVSECLAVLREMKECGTLGYFVYKEHYGFRFKRWEPGNIVK